MKYDRRSDRHHRIKYLSTGEQPNRPPRACSCALPYLWSSRGVSVGRRGLLRTTHLAGRCPSCAHHGHRPARYVVLNVMMTFVPGTACQAVHEEGAMRRWPGKGGGSQCGHDMHVLSNFCLRMFVSIRSFSHHRATAEDIAAAFDLEGAFPASNTGS